MAASFDYFEHEADIGVTGVGDTLAEAFVGGAQGLFNVMVDIDQVDDVRCIDITCSAFDIQELYIEWLNTLLAEADINEMVFCRFAIDQLTENTLHGHAFGESIDAIKHHVKTEVKGATYSMLSVEKVNDKFVVKCVVDV
ncbi:MAG: Protein archease [Candidatus Argoarchaeum ethanivorans]|uniref:Protein archease n=1 Tax=Candidatus Argoarchaeum ethanivorans TaxID=2608793 RepID=A0A812A1F7_9EURY|nr:MAG: Protein archease [Candidatus Argoarchaeum ethanivorans]